MGSFDEDGFACEFRDLKQCVLDGEVEGEVIRYVF